MATITGSSTIDWSGVALAPIHPQQNVDEFFSRFDQVVTDFNNDDFDFNSPPTSTLLSFTLTSAPNAGGIAIVKGSGFDTDNPVVKSFDYSNPSTGDVVSFTGTLDFVGNEVFNRLTIGSTGSQQTIIGNILVDPLGNILSGSITQLEETLGSATVIIKGSLVLSGTDISGTVTQISVLSGTSTILMSGLSLPYSALDSVTTANDLFSAVGNQMTGNDTITYTNNSSVGMSFYGGPGNDTITISGPNADTLNGGTGNDILNGGAGDDTLQGGDGNDVFLIGSAAEHGVGEVIDGGDGTDVIRFTSTTLGQTLVLAPGITTVESVVIGTAAGVTTGITALNVDASAVVGGGLSLTGNNGANILTGTGFDDVLTGNAGNDALNGGAGNDTLLGGLGQDTVNGGTGDDQITMLVTAGNVDTIDAGADTDTLVLSGVVPGNHVVVVDLSSTTDQVVSIGGVADAFTQINFENLNASGIGSSANVTGSASANIIIGSNGKDIIDGGAGNDTITGGAGADNLQGGAGNDLFLLASVTEFAAGEIINGGADTDTLRYTGNAAATLTLTANVTNIEQVEIANTAGDPTGIAAINVNAAAVVNGLTIIGNAGNNVLTGTGQADTISGNEGNDTLNGGAGDDTLQGGDGNDVFLIGSAAEHGVGEGIDGGLGADVIRFTSTTAGQTLVLASGVTAVESVVIGTAAGVTTGLTALNVDASAVGSGLSLTGNNGANILTGTDFDDVLSGNAGNDALIGGDGNDTLIGGLGQDTVNGGAGDDLVLLGSVAEYASGEVINGGDGTDTLRYTGNAAATLTLTANVTNIEQVQIANGAGLTIGLTAINVNAAAVTNGLTIIGNAGNNVLTGTSQADTLIGNAGNDTLNGGDDTDSLDGGLGNDILNGGAGDDTLQGGDGNDVFLIGSAAEHGVGEIIDGGDGTDVIRFTSTTLGQTLVLAPGITTVEGVVIGTAAGVTTGITALNVDASAVVGGGLSLTGNNGANILTGTDFDDVLTGNAGNDALNGGAGNDTLLGGLGQDTVNGGTGDDQITMLVTAGNVDTIDAGADTDTLVLSGVVPGNHVVVVDLSSTTDQVVSIGGVADAFTQINFENLNASGIGSSANVTGSASANIIIGSNGKDIIDGGAGNDTITGGAGADNLQGGAGNDLFLLASVTEFAAGEIINGGADTDTLRYTGNAAATLTLTANVTNIEQVEIANTAGDPTGIAAINVNAAAVVNGLTIIGNAGNNVLTGTGQADTISGNEGNDTLNGGAGDDTLQGGDGNDVFLIGSAAEHGVGEGIDGGLGADVIRFTSTTAGQTLVLAPGITAVEGVVIGTAAGVTTGLTALNVDASAVGSGLSLTGNNGANILTGTDFDDVLSGNAGNDALIGGDGNDTLIGGLGVDNLQGGTGDDLFLLASAAEFAAGEIINGGTDADTLRFTSTVAGTLTLTANVSSIEQVEIANAAGDPTGIAAINVNAAAVVNGLIITGNNGANVLTGTGFADTLTGNAGNDTLIGGDGNDSLDGGLGNDILNGGAGDDTLQGGDGNDVFLIGSAAEHGVGEVIDGGDGTDVIRFTSTTPGQTLVLAPGITTVEGVVIGTAAGVTTGITALNVDASAVGSGLSLTGNNGANILTGTGFDDVLTGNAGNDTLRGGLGNDTVNGGSGNDTFLFGSGDGQDLIQDSSGSADKILFDGGINPLDLVISRQANDLRLTIHGSSDQITVQNWYTSSVNRTETIQAGNGQTLLSTQVDQLIQAMAGFTVTTGLSWDNAIDGGGTAQQQTQFQGIIAASWQ